MNLPEIILCFLLKLGEAGVNRITHKGGVKELPGYYLFKISAK